MRRFPVALDPLNGAWLYPCAVAGCERLAFGVFCCVWCEYFDRFAVRINRHAMGCEHRRVRYEHIFRLDSVTPV